MKQIKTEEINATLAELLEPLQSVVREKNRHQSLLGVWTPINGSVEWQPLDFLHDARGTVMLQSWMHGHYAYFSVCWTGSGIEFEASGRSLAENFAITLPLMGDADAWTHAFLRANGITVEE